MVNHGSYTETNSSCTLGESVAAKHKCYHLLPDSLSLSHVVTFLHFSHSYLCLYHMHTHSCIKGFLIEINENLISQPGLLKSKVNLEV